MSVEVKLNEFVEISPFCQEDFHVSHTVVQENVRELLMSVIYGPNSGESLAKLNPDGSWVKMSRGYCQVTLGGSLEEFSETWPRWGIMLRGVVGRLPELELPIVETGCSSWPTPTTADCYVDKLKSSQQKHGSMHSVNLSQDVQMFPSPTASMMTTGDMEQAKYHSSKRPEYKEVNGGALNPQWVEWLMGFPPGWTDLDA